MQQFRFEDLFLNSEFIFESGVSEEEIWSFYFQPVNFNKKYVNILRKDTHPDCVYYISKNGWIRFKDFAIGKSWNCFEIVMEIFQIDYYSALKQVYNDLIKKIDIIPLERKESVLEVRKTRIENNTGVNLKVKIKDFTIEELNFWNLEGVLNLDQEYLQAQGIYSISILWEDQYTYTNLKMVFAYIENNIITQIYFPTRKKGSRRFINRKGFILGNLNNISYASDFLVITKSKKDTLFLRLFNIDAIYTTSEGFTATLESIEFLKSRGYKYIYTLMDRDRTGFKSAIRHKWKYDFDYLFVPDKNSKDFTDWLKNCGIIEVSETIEAFKNSI